ncbi:metal ABC transporter ATP-binding protein [Enterococcus gilvus]|uniref:metal ABC transporter ATP-binding protein n=1 Tax=Enterococcus gilvus TaxID=160453 RepID=UPI0028D35926|nr:metal ABC transporter ATP-binding protein [Enterococcus gilvus]
MIEIGNLSVSYNGFLALENISVSLDNGQMTGIIGPNGAGKSTLIKAMLNIIPHSGQVIVDSKSIKKKLKNISYVEQKADIDYTFPIKVKECVSLGLYSEMSVLKKMKKKDWEKVAEALKKVNLAEYSNNQIGELSGGQFQRVLLARCLVQNAEYIFLDEPFVGIDLISEVIIVKILKELRDAGKTILVIHHDLSKVKEYFDSLIILNRELVAYGNIDETLTEINLKKAYGNNIFIDKQV